MFVEDGHDRNHLKTLVKENKHQAPKNENTGTSIVKLS